MIINQSKMVANTLGSEAMQRNANGGSTLGLTSLRAAHNLTEDTALQQSNGNHHRGNGSGIADYSDMNGSGRGSHTQSHIVSNFNNSEHGQIQMIKGTKYSNKVNQRSQSVLKSHTEFNHNFGMNNQNTTGSMGSSSTQRAINNYISAPGSKGTTKAVGQAQQLGMKPFGTNASHGKHIRSKKLVNISDKMAHSSGNQNIMLHSSAGGTGKNGNRRA